jgi:hypothetical protein
VTERENDLGDSDITTMLEKLDPAEMARLEEYFKSKGGAGVPFSSTAGPSPPPAPAPASSMVDNFLFSSKKMFLASSKRECPLEISAEEFAQRAFC